MKSRKITSMTTSVKREPLLSDPKRLLLDAVCQLLTSDSAENATEAATCQLLMGSLQLGGAIWRAIV